MDAKRIAKIKFYYEEIDGDSSSKSEIVVPLFVATQTLSKLLDWKENTESTSFKCAEEYLEAIKDYESKN